MKAAWEPSTDSVTASIRFAMKRSASGGIALSCSDTMYHVGRSFQPTRLAGSVMAAALSGRWLTAIGPATSIGRSAQKVSWKSGILMKRSGPPAAPGASYDVGSEVVAPSDGGDGSCTLAQLSPESRAKAERNTRPLTSSIPGEACEMTAPP